jgi:hypothetical protein
MITPTTRRNNSIINKMTHTTTNNRTRVSININISMNMSIHIINRESRRESIRKNIKKSIRVNTIRREKGNSMKVDSLTIDHPNKEVGAEDKAIRTLEVIQMLTTINQANVSLIKYSKYLFISI